MDTKHIEPHWQMIETWMVEKKFSANQIDWMRAAYWDGVKATFREVVHILGENDDIDRVLARFDEIDQKIIEQMLKYRVGVFKDGPSD